MDRRAQRLILLALLLCVSLGLYRSFRGREYSGWRSGVGGGGGVGANETLGVRHTYSSATTRTHGRVCVANMFHFSLVQ